MGRYFKHKVGLFKCLVAKYILAVAGIIDGCEYACTNLTVFKCLNVILKEYY